MVKSPSRHKQQGFLRHRGMNWRTAWQCLHLHLPARAPSDFGGQGMSPLSSDLRHGRWDAQWLQPQLDQSKDVAAGSCPDEKDRCPALHDSRRASQSVTTNKTLTTTLLPRTPAVIHVRYHAIRRICRSSYQPELHHTVPPDPMPSLLFIDRSMWLRQTPGDISLQKLPTYTWLRRLHFGAPTLKTVLTAAWSDVHSLPLWSGSAFGLPTTVTSELSTRRPLW